jgi:hypothetical protein
VLEQHFQFEYRLCQKGDFPDADAVAQNAHAELVANGRAVDVKDMPETAALQAGQAGIACKVFWKEKDEIHGKRMSYSNGRY